MSETVLIDPCALRRQGQAAKLGASAARALSASPATTPRARASLSVRNPRSPVAVSIRVFAYEAPPGTW